MLLPGELHHDSRLTFAPGPKGPGVFFFCSWPSTSGSGHSRLPEERRPCHRADLRSCCTASEPPELAQPGEDAAGHCSRPPSLGKRTRRPGESGISHSQHQAKLADIRVAAARIAQAEGPERPVARCGNIGPLRPSMSRRQIFPSGSLPSGSHADRLT